MMPSEKMSPQELALNIVVGGLGLGAQMDNALGLAEPNDSAETFETMLEALSALFPYPELIAKAIGTSGAAKAFGIVEVAVVDNPGYVGPYSTEDGSESSHDGNQGG